MVFTGVSAGHLCLSSWSWGHCWDLRAGSLALPFLGRGAAEAAIWCRDAGGGLGQGEARGVRPLSGALLCDPVDCSPPGAPVHGVLQAGRLEWVASPPPGDLPDAGMEPASLTAPALAGGSFTTEPPGTQPITSWSNFFLSGQVFGMFCSFTQEETKARRCYVTRPQLSRSPHTGELVFEPGAQKS